MANMGYGFGMDNSSILVVYSKDGKDSSLTVTAKIGGFQTKASLRLDEDG